MARKIKVEIVGDASSLHRALGQAANSGNTLGSSLARLGKQAAFVGGAAALGGLFVTLKAGFSELSESQQVMAQTEAGLKSTGSAANVTAKEITNLASAQSKLTGIDDEAVQAGENMLLTFTNIRNEVGKGNDIFNQATVALDDMATKMAGGNIPTAEQLSTTAIRLGKALNDPVKGMGALSRVGVQFDKDQAKAITTMVKSGDTMGAQKLILKELTKEFGGSAKAAGDTFPGQLAKLRNSFDEIAGALVQQLLPYMQRFVDFINRNMPTIQAVMKGVADVIAGSFKLIGEAVSKSQGPIEGFVGFIQDAFGFLKGTSTQATIVSSALGGLAAAIVIVVGALKAWTAAQIVLNAVMAINPLAVVAVAIIALGAALVIAYQRSETFRNIVNGVFSDIKSVVLPIVEALRAAWDRFGTDIIRIARQAFGVLKAVILTPLQNVFDAMAGILALFRGDWSDAWDHFKQIPIRTLNALVTVVKGMGGLFLEAARAIGAAIIAGVVAGLKALPGAVVRALGAIQTAIDSAAAAAAGWAFRIGVQIVQGVLNGLGGLAAAVKDKVESGLRSALSSINPFSPIEEGAARLIGEPIVRGAIQGLERLEATFTTKTTQLVKDAVTHASDAIKAGQGKFADAWSGYSSAALSVFDNIASQVQTRSEKALANLQAAHDKAQVIGAVQEARAGLATAQAGGDAEQILQAQKTLDDALYQQKVYGLQIRAEAERKDADDRIALDRTRFETWLSTRTAQQQVQIATEGRGMAGIIAKIKSYDPLFKDRGVEIGKSLAEGLRDAKGWVVDAANELAAAVQRAMGVAIDAGNMPAKNLADSLNSQRSRIGGMAAGGIVTSPTLTWVGERGPEAVIPLSQLGGGGGTIVFSFPNYLGSKEDLINEIRVGLFEIARRNPGALPGVA